MWLVWLVAALMAAWPGDARAQSVDAARIRAAFLDQIDRPRVSLAPESRPRRDSGFYLAEHFTFASAAMLQTYRTGRGRPYLYDTVWDVMRLIDYLQTRSDVDAARIGVQSFRWALEHDEWQPRAGTFWTAVEAAARGEGIAQVDAAFLRRFYDRVVPVAELVMADWFVRWLSVDGR